VPVILMVAIIPIFKNDYLLFAVYGLIIIIAFAVKYQANDILFFSFGFFAMMISEYFFISTGVETFLRNSLFGLMPLWLPLLWAYGFVAIKRAIVILL
jgi:hypothetical protein